MPSPTADVSKEHLKFDSSVTGDGDNLGLDWLQCNYELGAYQQFTSVPQYSDQSFERSNENPFSINGHILTNYSLVLPVCLRSLPLSLHISHPRAFYKVNKHIYTDSTLESASLSAYMRRQGANKSSWSHSKTNQDHLSESYWITKANNEHKMYGQEDIFSVVLLVQLVLITVIVFPEVQWIQHTGVCWPKN